MNNPRHVLLIEDNTLQSRSLKTELEQAGWHVLTAKDRTSTERRIEQSEKMVEEFDLFMVDLGLLPTPDDPFKSGIPLIRNLREQFPSMPILAYTALKHYSAFRYEQVLKTLLPNRVSFLYLRRLDEDSLSDILNLVWLGYLFVSPAPATRLPYAVTDEPDPLDARDWEILRLVSENYTNPAIAAEIQGLGKDGVRDRLKKIRQNLVDLGWLAEYNLEREDLKHWYQEHAVRFSRS